MPKISFCIPCYRSEKTISAVIAEIEQLMANEQRYSFEIVCVVDGSPDNVLGVLTELCRTKDFLKVVNFTKNFGQASARMASLRFASGDFLVCLDDDGQCPLDHVFDLLQPLEKQADVAIAQYPQKKQSAFKNFGSKVNEKMIHFLLDVDKNFQMSNFYAMKSFIAQQILTYHNPYPYITGLLVQSTRNFAYVPMEERCRLSGTSGYTLSKLINLWLNGATNFSVRPLRMADLLGVFCAVFGFGLGMTSIFQKLFSDNIQVGYTSIFSAIFFVGGIIMLLLGIIGEYVGRIFVSMNNSPQYVIKSVFNIDCKDAACDSSSCQKK
ncbi:MAG: glycosyltransferase [Desulfovibrio sp.]|nr:glycosyltransferase [Desulfovibrio sp.]